MQARLTITSPLGDVTEKLIGNTAIIGRGSSVHVRLSGDPQVSRYHALLRCFNGYQYQLVDLGSRNGSHVGSSLVVTPAQLSDEAYLRIGDHEIFLQALHATSDDMGMTMDGSSYIDVAVMVMGIPDFSEIQTTYPPMQVAQQLGTWNRNLYSYMGQCGGTPDKFVKDSMVAFWKEHPLEVLVPHVLAVAHEVLKYGRSNEWAPGHPFKICCAIHTGKVALGMTSGNDPDEPLIGGAVNAALKLQDAASKQDHPIVISEAARNLAGPNAQAQLQEVGFAEIGGREFSTKMFGFVP